ncbi:hypothetical protein [Limnohabitans sp. Rim47]|nr:hypothetical protein [Limnohabitans sp. Rim47]
MSRGAFSGNDPGVLMSAAEMIAIKSKIVYTSVDRFGGPFKALQKPPF